MVQKIRVGGINILEVDQTTDVNSGNGSPVIIDPDLDFIRIVDKQTGNPFKKCMQCGTCSATCEISPDDRPFPGKEMAWAVWGMKDRLLSDPDVWLCHQCNDCSERCPRTARPGDVLAAIRQVSIAHYSFPRFMGRWLREPQAILLLFGLPVLLLSIALAVKEPIEKALGIGQTVGDNIIYAYSSMFPHWLLISFFLLFTIIPLTIVIAGAVRFWKAMDRASPTKERKGFFPSLLATLDTIVSHNNFTKCKKATSRFWSHGLVFFGFIALCMVTLWIITARINPLIQGDFIYPFAFLSPWKILANLGGAALLAGCFWMMWERFFNSENINPGSYFDWVLIGTLALVVITGFVTEVLHYVRLDPHRHLIYFAHLVFVLGLLLYLPYSKFAHMIYRATAFLFAEYSGRSIRQSNGEVKQSVIQDESSKSGDK